MKKITKKMTFMAFGAAAIVAPIASTVSCGNGNTSGQFLNYEDYVSADAKDLIEKGGYTYSTFVDLPEIRTAIDNKKIVGAVGSDYYNAQLANEGLIQKLDLNAIFDGLVSAGKTFSIETPLTGADLEAAVKGLYTSQTWNLMNSFTLTGSADNSKLWEYMVPYFIQQKVVAFNPNIVNYASSVSDATKQTLKGFDQAEINNIFDENNDGKLSYTEIFKKLSALGFKTMSVNNYFRDNIAIGTEASTSFTMDVNKGNANQRVKDMATIFGKFTGRKILTDSGLETIQTILDPTLNTNATTAADVAIAYNGDALDVFQGADQTEDKKLANNAQIRVLKAKNSTFLLDGIIVPTYVNGKALDSVTQTIRKAFVDHLTTVDGDAKDQDSITSFNMGYKNFDEVNYTTPFNAIYDDVKSTYFSELETAPNTVATGSNQYMANNIFPVVGKIDKDHLTTPIDSDTEATVNSEYKAIVENWK